VWAVTSARHDDEEDDKIRGPGSVSTLQHQIDRHKQENPPKSGRNGPKPHINKLICGDEQQATEAAPLRANQRFAKKKRQQGARDDEVIARPRASPTLVIKTDSSEFDASSGEKRR